SFFFPPSERCSMRIPLLCSVAVLCAAGAAHAQGWPAPQQGSYDPYQAAYAAAAQGYSNQGYPNGYPGAYPTAAPQAPFDYANGYYHFQQYQPPAPVPPGDGG